jgi:adenylate kinase
MQDIIIIDVDCSVNKIVGYDRGLPLLVGLKSEMLALLSSELGSELPISP